MIGTHYLQYDYDQRLRPGASPDFIGPFPAVEAAEYFRKYNGPVDAAVVDLPTPPDPAYTQTPGQVVDRQLQRW